MSGRGSKTQSRISQSTQPRDEDPVRSMFPSFPKEPRIQPSTLPIARNKQGFPKTVPLHFQSNRNRGRNKSRPNHAGADSDPAADQLSTGAVHKTQVRHGNNLDDEFVEDTVPRARANVASAHPSVRAIRMGTHRKLPDSPFITTHPSLTSRVWVFRLMDRMSRPNADQQQDSVADADNDDDIADMYQSDEDQMPPLPQASVKYIVPSIYLTKVANHCNRSASKKLVLAARKQPLSSDSSSGISSDSEEDRQSSSVDDRDEEDDDSLPHLDSLSLGSCFGALPFLRRNLPRTLQLAASPQAQFNFKVKYAGNDLPTVQLHFRLDKIYCPFFCGVPALECANIPALQAHLLQCHPRVRAQISEVRTLRGNYHVAYDLHTQWQNRDVISIALTLPSSSFEHQPRPVTRPLGKSTAKQKLLPPKIRLTTSEPPDNGTLHRNRLHETLASMHQSVPPETSNAQSSSHSTSRASTTPAFSLDSGSLGHPSATATSSQTGDTPASAHQIPFSEDHVQTPGPLERPPPEDPLGPAARPPYCNPSNGGLPFSLRVGGEKIYDILAEESLAEFGLAAAEIRDREEEMFDCDDLTPEMKAMFAIWARWSWWPKNRNQIVSKPRKGFEAFLDKYWLLIHRCCGYRVLANFMATLCAMRIISGDDIRYLLKLYTDRTRMDEWAPLPQF